MGDKRSIGASLDAEFVGSIETYLEDELDGMSKTDFLRRTLRLGMMVDPSLLEIIVGNEVTVSLGDKPTPDLTGDKPTTNNEIDYNDLSLGHDLKIDPDDADFSDNNVLKETNKQRTIVLKGMIKWMREEVDEWSKARIQKTELESLIKRTFAITREQTIDQIITLCVNLDILKPHITADPRLTDSVSELRTDVVRMLNLQGFDERATEIENRVNTLHDLSGMWSSNSGGLVKKWFEPEEVYYFTTPSALNGWRDASMGAIKSYVGNMALSPGSNRILTRMFAVAIREDIMTETEAEDMRNSYSSAKYWFTNSGVESVFQTGMLEIKRQEWVDEREHKRQAAVDRMGEIENEVASVLDALRSHETNEERDELLDEFQNLAEKHDELVAEWDLDPVLPDHRGNLLSEAVQAAS